VPHSSDTSPGGKVSYAIWVWSTVTARHVTASITSSPHATRVPRFTLCPVSHRRTCLIGTLRANQAFELKVADRIRSTATAGRAITLAVTVAARSLSPAEAAVTIVVGQPGQGGSTPPSTPPALPPPTFAPVLGTTITPAGLTGLFPTVTPRPSPSPSRAANASRLAGVTQTSSALPLDPRLIGGQLAGLAVLAAAITMVVARLSLRTPQATGAGGPAKGGGTSSPAGAADKPAN